MVSITWEDEVEQNVELPQEDVAPVVANQPVNPPSVNVKWQEPPKQEKLLPPKSQGEFFDRIAKLASNRKEEMTGAVGKYGRGELGLGSTLLQVVGKGGFGTAADLVGETVASGVSAVVPDAVEEPIKQYAYEMLGKAYNSEIGKVIAREWNKLDPETQNNLEATGNIMAWATPKLKAGGVGDKLTNMGQVVKKGRMANKLQLPDTAKNRLAEAKRRFRPPYAFDEVVEEVSKLKTTSPNKSFKANITAVGDEIAALDKNLFRELRKRSVDIPEDLIDQKIDLELTNLLKNNQWIQSNASIASAFDNNIAALQKILDDSPNTPQGLLVARRKFDKLLKDSMFEIPVDERIARDAVSTVLRRTLNDVVSEAAPYAPVKETLRKQSRLYNGLDNLAENYALEKPPLAELRNIAQRYPGASVGVLAGASPFIAAAPQIAAIAGAGAVGAGAYRGFPAALRGSGAALSTVGRATDVSRISANLDRLPLLRSALLYGNEGEEEEQRVPLQSAQNQ